VRTGGRQGPITGSSLGPSNMPSTALTFATVSAQWYADVTMIDQTKFVNFLNQLIQSSNSSVSVGKIRLCNCRALYSSHSPCGFRDLK